jgi:hypothetical protein
MPGGRIILELAAGLITSGGLYDLLTPRLPANLVRMTSQARDLMQSFNSWRKGEGAATKSGSAKARRRGSA